VAEKTFHFLGGLPRSGSTLLCNMLAQNPRLHATHTSACMDVMFGVRNNWDRLVEHKAHPNGEAKRRVLRAILDAYYAEVRQPVIIDKCRGWVSLLEMAEWALERPVKVLVPVRDLREVLASFEKLWRKNARGGQVRGEAENYFDFQTVEGRCAFWCRKDQPVGLAYNRIKDALQRGYRDRMCFVHFERLTSQPEETLRTIYRFLGEEPYQHDFDHVEQVTWEDDTVHGFEDLHRIRPKVEPVPPSWPEILGRAAEKYANESFWINL